MAGSLLKLAAKVGVAVGAVYITLDKGIWSSASRGGMEALKNLRAQVFPGTNEYLDKVPTTKSLNTSAVNSWNSGVQKTFAAVAAAPDTACMYSRKAIDQLKEATR